MSDRAAPWDLTALLNAAAPTLHDGADAQQTLAERHLWLIRAMEWLRHAPVPGEPLTPTPVLRLKHMLNVLERNPAHRANVASLLQRFWQGVDVAALFADFGFAPRTHFAGELLQRLRLKLLPQTPVTTDLGELFGLLFPHPGDALWLEALDEVTLHRLIALHAAETPPLQTPEPQTPQPQTSQWQTPLLDAIMFLSSSVRASGFSNSLRPRMSSELLVDAPFSQLARVAETVCEQVRNPSDQAELMRNAQYLRALLDTCRQCADSVHEHLEEHGVSINVVFEVDQLRERTHRIEQLLTCVLSTDPSRDMTLLLADLVRTANERRSVRALFARHYSLLARKVAERSAETGEHYITRDRAEYAQMLRKAVGGGAVIAGTTLMKFALGALTVSAFWAGFLAGVNYAGSFVLVHVLHWTVATKQPAMTAPAMADKLGNLADDEAVESFVDEVAHLIRSQVAGIIGNLSAVIPIVLAVQWLSRAVFGSPVVGSSDAQHVLESVTLLGPTAFFAAFTGVLLFASSLIAGWVENWFVWNRLDSAIAWNPNIVARLGAARAQRWALYWRQNISGYASNISLGFLLGLVPAVAAFFGLPVEVRHVTLATGQIAAAVGAQGWAVFQTSAFWWCVASIPVIAVLNLGVSFWLAFKVALRSRGIRLADRSRIYRAIRRRVAVAPSSFIVPPRA
jgi:site-specific recombinase